MGNAEELRKVEDLVSASKSQAREKSLNFEYKLLIINQQQAYFNKIMAITGSVVSIVMVLSFLNESFKIYFSEVGQIFTALVMVGSGIFIGYVIHFLKDHM